MSSQGVLLPPSVAPWMIDAVNRLARSEERTLLPHLETVGTAVTLENTRARCHCHFVARNAQRRVMVEELAQRLADQVVDYCIPRSRIAEASQAFARTGSTEKFVRLQAEAAELFTTLTKSGEGGEVLLYFLLEVALGIPQLLCKMPHKTSSQMHVHGTDGVHGMLLDNGDLAIYWCEAKLYQDVAAAVRVALDDLAPYLLDDGSGPSRRDILLARDHLDAGDPVISRALRKFFEDGALESARLQIRGACLIGFSLDDYPEPFGEGGKTVTEAVEKEIRGWQQAVSTRVGAAKIAAFNLEVFCVPMPSVSDLRSRVRQHLKLA